MPNRGFLLTRVKTSNKIRLIYSVTRETQSLILWCRRRQEALLSDEEAQEVHRLLTPSESSAPDRPAEVPAEVPAETAPVTKEEPEWMKDILGEPNDSALQESAVDHR